jgi:hypothetical protein
MKINVTQQLKSIEGEPLTTPKATCPQCGQATEAVPVTVRQIVTGALMAQRQGETLSGEEKVRRYALALRVHNENEPDLPVEDVALIKELVGQGYGPLVVGQVWVLLDPAE